MRHKVEIISHVAADTLCKTVVLAAGLLSVGVVANAQQTFEVDGIAVTVNGSGATVTGIDSKTTAVYIPEAITVDSKKYQITGLSAGAFKGNTSITSVTFGDDLQITSIPDECFMECTALQTVNLSPLITTLGEKAFYGCTRLMTVNMNNGTVKKLPAYCFYGCKNYETTVPGGVEEIGDYCFYGNKLDNKKAGLSANTEDSRLKSIGEYAFANCLAVSDGVVIPANVSHIGTGAFQNTELNVFEVSPENTVLAELPSYCLDGCKIHSLQLTDNIEKIGSNTYVNDAPSKLKVYDWDGTSGLMK